LFKSFHLPSSLSTPRERLRVRDIVKTFSSSFSPLHLAGEGQGEGDILSILLSPYKLPLHPAGEGQGEGHCLNLFIFLLSLSTSGRGQG